MDSGSDSRSHSRQGTPHRPERFHGRVEAAGAEACAHPGCPAPGEFRAPLSPSGFDGPGRWRLLCLDHVRAFNAGYDYFAGMSADQILAAQRPMAGWERETRAFATGMAGGPGPRWADFADPLDTMDIARATPRHGAGRRDGRRVGADEQRDLHTLGLTLDADRRALRQRYSELVRRYHPDRNGGDRRHEARLRAVIDAYDRLKRSPLFAGGPIPNP